MSEERKPLWPKAIEVVGGTGEYESGKTTFGLTICPGEETLYYDFEKSGATYESDLGFTRIDVPAEMQKKHPNGYKPIDVFNWWIGHVRSQRAGQYRVIVADPASDIEQGLADWVASNPRYFNRTPGQYLKMSGLMWGDMKAYWKTILADIAARCETFYFTTHMANVWKGDKPSKERKAKGKETLFEMASLYLKFERKKDEDAVPSAVVLKSRLSKITVDEDDEDGEVKSIPLLPPRLPVATPAAVRRYMKNPPDYANLKPEEKIGEAKLSDDEKLLLQAQIADANRDAALANNDREERQGTRLGGVSNRPKASTSRSEGSASNSTQAVEDESTEDETTQTDSVEPVDPESTDDSDTSVDSAQDDATANDDAATTDDATADVDASDATSHGEQLEEAVTEAIASASSTSHDPRFPAPDAPVGKGQLGSLRQCIASYVKLYPDKQANIMEGIRRRNPKATSEADLTNGQAEDMEASLLRILNGPHEETTPVIESASSSSTPAAGKEGTSTRVKSKSR